MDDATKAAALKGREDLFQHIWNTRFAPIISAELADEAARYADAFADGATFTVCGEELRVMTPADLMFLDGMGSPFVAGGAEPTILDMEFFMWSLHSKNKPGWAIVNAFKRGRFSGRFLRWLNQNGLDAAILEIFRYMDRIFLDIPTGDMGSAEDVKPPTVHSIAPLLVAVSAGIGPRDPMTGKILGETPIPRLIQYNRAINKQTGRDTVTQFDSRRSQCLEEVNKVMAELKTT